MRDPASRVWLVTGASSGFGRAIVEAAVADGDGVVATARSTEPIQDLAVAHPDQVDAVQCHRPGADHLGRRSCATAPRASRCAGQQRRAYPRRCAYSATKFALEGLSEALADEVGAFGIKVLIVEPGTFRTGVFSAGSASAETTVYADSVGKTRQMIQNGDGQQPGDPAKAAAAILRALKAERIPLRLPLGADAYDMIDRHLESVRGELEEWRAVIRDTAFD